MPIDYQWHAEHDDLIVMTLSGMWTWSEMLAVQHKLNDEMDDTDVHTVHFIVDTTHSDGIPSGALGAMPRMFNIRHPKRGATLIVGASGLIVTLWTILSRAYPPATIPRYMFLETFAQALDAYRQFSLANTDET